MQKDYTVQELTKTVEEASTDFEKTNTDLKRRYLIWNIEAFNIIASAVSVSRCSFGTGYPFYALDKNLEGHLPVIHEQIRYNRELVRDGVPVQKSIWLCKSCLEKNYENMPDLKRICKPCPNVINELKPRKIINRLPDIDMWLVCEDGSIEKAQEEISILLEKYNMHTSDKNPFASIEDVVQISQMLKDGKFPKIHLPIDSHIIEYSELKSLIEQVPEVLADAKKKEITPYLPIHPKSYRKKWQYDDEAYNFIYDFLSAFTSFNFPEDLQQTLDDTRMKIVAEYSEHELFDFIMKSATEANFRRFHTPELEENFFKRVESWNELVKSSQESLFAVTESMEQENMEYSDDEKAR
jgi:hypothetical protein